VATGKTCNVESEVFVRLNKYIASCGIASRRGADELIAAGKVTVNGSAVLTMGPGIDAELDVVCVNGARISLQAEDVYIMLNKPAGYLTSCSDDRGRKTVLDLIAGVDARIYPVGRLDLDTEGLLILTSDGDFAYRCTHPKHEISKKYLAEVEGPLDENAIRLLRSGVVIDGKRTSQAGVSLLEKNGSTARLYVTIHEGRNRQVKKMFEAVGCKVIYLKRESIGGLELGDMAAGKWRYLGEDDFKRLGVTKKDSR
jgi:pseudouridine synthase